MAPARYWPVTVWSQATGRSERAIETHPQFHLKRLIERMGVARAEVMRWPGEPTSSGGPSDRGPRGRSSHSRAE